jgi:membrane protease YdiL (CAAX protease family)
MRVRDRRRGHMKPAVRLVVGVGMGVVVYFLGLLAVPSLGPIERLVGRTSWLSRGDVSQVTYLVLSLVLIALLSGWTFKGYGFKRTRAGKVLKPVLISATVSFVLIVLTMVALMATGGPPGEGDQQPGSGGGLLKQILSIWVLASVCEEVFNRGLVLGFLGPLSAYGVRFLKQRITLPVAISAIGFGIGHLCLLGAMDTRLVVFAVISATVLGFIAGYHREKTGSLLPAIAVHMTFNIVGGTISLILTSLAPK